MLSRRTFIITGTTSVSVIGAFAASHILRDAQEVREPWSAATVGFGDVRLNALAYAILTPNPHNRQPWLVRLDGADGLTLFCDLNRRLPSTDPFDRQITVGLGGFLELLCMSAAEQGYLAVIRPFPNGEPQRRLDKRPIASVQFRKDASAAADPLFKLALLRRTSRLPFEDKPISHSILAQLASTTGLNEKAIFGTASDPDRVSQLKTMCRQGWEIETRTERTHQESVGLTRIGADEVRQNPDGISLYGPAMQAYALTGLLSRENLKDASSKAFGLSMDFYTGLIDSARAFCWLGSPGNSRVDQLNAGRDWVRLHLAMTQAGLSFQPLSQILQEFPEMAGLYRQFHEAMGVKEPARIQGLFRLGYAAAPQPSPRWPLKSRLATSI